MAMSYWGKVSKGTVVLPPGANLPEGTEVRVEPVAPKTLAERLKDVIGTVQGGPPDWAENHYHYIHGAPKKWSPYSPTRFTSWKLGSKKEGSGSALTLSTTGLPANPRLANPRDT
jgi:hypothetical protein